MKIYDEVREFVTNIFYNGAVVKAWLVLRDHRNCHYYYYSQRN